MPKIRLNGKELEVGEEKTVLDIARAEGADIPTLCLHEGLGPYGACRLCIVEAEGPLLRRSLMTSCNLAVSDGLSVETDSPLVKKARKVIIEMLLGRSPDSKYIRDLARRFGVETTRFAVEKADNCVRCGLCVRACRDRIGVSAICFAGRGQKRTVTSEFGKLSEYCIGCGACVSVCPTGAIMMEDVDDVRTVRTRDVVIARHMLEGCGRCGRPYAVKKMLSHVAARVETQPAVKKRGICPDCARQHYAEEMAGELMVY